VNSDPENTTSKHSNIGYVIPSRVIGKPNSGSIGPVSTRQCQSGPVSIRLSLMVRTHVRLATKDVGESKQGSDGLWSGSSVSI
jgi:hypothetical protein